MKVFLLILVLTLSAAAQCTLAPSDSPIVRGLQLGMTRQKVASVLGPATFVNGETWSYNPRAKSFPALEGIDFVLITFYQNKVSVLSVDYDRLTPFEDVQDFAVSVTIPFKLPANGWRRVSPTDLRMPCKGFSIVVKYSLYPVLVIVDDEAIRQQDEDDAKAKDAKKRAFKP